MNPTVIPNTADVSMASIRRKYYFLNDITAIEINHDWGEGLIEINFICEEIRDDGIHGLLYPEKFNTYTDDTGDELFDFEAWQTLKCLAMILIKTKTHIFGIEQFLMVLYETHQAFFDNGMATTSFNLTDEGGKSW